MSADTLFALVLFAFATSITPGPNNMMLFASGVNFGFRRTVPHMLGIGAGFLSLLIGVGMGLGAVLHAYPPAFIAQVEALAWQRQARLANRAFRRSVAGLGMLVGYAGLRRLEVARGISLAEGIRLGVPADALQARLLPRAQTEVAHA